jgi:hypothetical protein
MTVASPVARVSYAGNGTAGPFTIPFRFFSSADLRVIRTDIAGGDDDLLEGSEYTLAGVRNPNGTLTLTVPLPVGERLTILRVATGRQGGSFRNQGSYFGSAHEDALDQLAMQVAALKDQVDRALTLPASLDPAEHVMEVAPQTGKALVWQSDTQLGNATIDGGAVAIPGGGRTVATTTAYLLNNAVFNVKDYGAKGDGATVDTTAFQAAINAAHLVGGGEVYVPAMSASYVVGDLVSYANVAIVGDGWASKIQKATGATYILSVNPGSGGTTDPAANATNIYIASLWMVGLSVSVGFSEHHHALNLNAVSDVLIENVKITAFEGDGVLLGSSNDAATERHNERVTFRNCVFDGVNKANRNAISIIDGTDITVENCTFTRTTRSDMPGAIDIEPDSNAFARVRNIQITGNTFDDIGGFGGAINLALPLGQSALTTPVFGISFERNHFRNGNGIVLSQFGETKTDATVGLGIRVRGNTMDTVVRGIQILGIKDAEISDNRFRRLSAQPIVGGPDAENKCLDITFRDNTWDRVDTTSGGGLAIYAVDRLTFDDDTFIDCGKSDGTFGYCMDFVAGTSTYVTIKNCTFLDPGSKTVVAIQKEAGHTFTPGTNWQDNNLFGPGVGANNFVSRQKPDVSGDLDANADQAVSVGVRPPTLFATGTMTAGRKWTFARGNLGDSFRVYRIAGGAFTLSIFDFSDSAIASASLAAAGNWVQLVWSVAADTWRVVAKG